MPVVLDKCKMMFFRVLFPLAFLSACTTVPSETRPLQVSSTSFMAEGTLPTTFAFCKMEADGKAGFGNGGNRNPDIRWSRGPAGSLSYAVVMHDDDVPQAYSTLANKQSITIPVEAPRKRFYHWALVDIPYTISNVPERGDSSEVQKGGKPLGKSVNGRRAQNDYALYLNQMPEWKGTWGGYDGPCPPWNDARIHRYIFTVYALNVPKLDLKKDFTAREALKAMEGHILATGQIRASYTLSSTAVLPPSPITRTKSTQ